mmetsp:Transcript_26294/g.40461  ORF Transcript_26294/g.40461 Transcript_26294/m.40461 type:complete len:425 (+) Transcript_26294:88-1362(+)
MICTTPLSSGQTNGPVNSRHLLPSHEWSDIVRYTTAEDLHSLRLVGSKDMHLSDPSVTSHLSIRMDKAPFFSTNNSHTVDQIRRWLTNRRTLVINDVNSKICPSQVAYLVRNGFLDSVSDIIVMDCHFHLDIISILSHLPNLESLKLVDRGDEEVLDDLEAIITHVGRITSLQHLDIEFDCAISGSRLSIISEMYNLRYLRLRGFDLSEGMSNMSGLTRLETLHLCHGNFYSSPDDDVNEKDLLHLMNMTSKIDNVHLEGFDSLSNNGLSVFNKSQNSLRRLVLKHCQELSKDSLPCIGRMRHLESLHIVNSAYDDAPIFESEDLQHLNSLIGVKSLSLFYVLEDVAHLRALWGMESLEVLNIALEENPDEEEVEDICLAVLSSFVALKRLRIFTEDGMSYSYQRGGLEIEHGSFNFGDQVFLD